MLSSSSGRKSDDGVLSRREAEVMKVLQDVAVPGETEDAVYSGNVTKIREADGIVKIELKLSEHYRALKGEVAASLKRLDWVHITMNVQIKMEAAKPGEPAVTPQASTKEDAHSGCGRAADWLMTHAIISADSRAIHSQAASLNNSHRMCGHMHHPAC